MIILTILKAGLFQRFIIVEIHMTSQYKIHGRCLKDFNMLAKKKAITLLNIK